MIPCDATAPPVVSMDITTFSAMLNVEPHHFEATFDKPYDQITANDVLEKAATFIDAYATNHCWRHRIPVSMKGRPEPILRYLKKEDAFVNSSATPPGSPLSECYPSPYSRVAASWYWTTGYSLSSVAVEVDSLLASIAPLPDTTNVRWYILLSMSLDPTVSFVPFGLQDAGILVRKRKEYMDLVRRQKSQTPASNNLWPRSEYGPNPVTLVPIFAETYNMLAYPETVELEIGTREGAFDVHRNVSRFILAANQQFNNEKKFSAGIFVVLKELLDFLDLELHHTVYSGLDDSQAAEIDWIGFCHTVHRMLCIPFSGKGREKYGTEGDSIVQNLLELQRLLAIRREFGDFIMLTACPILILAVEGTYVRVSAMYFSARIHSVELFRVHLKLHNTPQERHDLAVKFQVVRNTVRKLCEFYTNLHAAMRPPTVPYLFPQPLSLLQCLIPSPAPEVVRHLSSLNLTILESASSLEDSRPLYKGVIFPFQHRQVVRVIVKVLSGEYGVAAHKLLAQQDPPLAPKLYWCGAITVGHVMVIMEEVQTEPGRMDPHPCNYHQDDVDIVQRDIGRAVNILHEHGLVHGDLRVPNMVIHWGRGYLIDFDWAGVEGVARYPPSLNPEVKWPDDHNNLLSMPISKEDDKARFKRTIEELLGKHDPPPSEIETARTNKLVPVRVGRL
ncbi:hypothetical protein GSI_00210 [Ganoderma sinense ZZ0214-1]|uniref:Protein kinase domain-containing protein n=1 Tax=Ganoderma sinense ZZ0214-1 TaxID=1077348 RepID=A0A2G8SRW1_9APHY|nr:hypothetical protein GSI_00210 [Ganoderma sinense ZZ0214-1]